MAKLNAKNKAQPTKPRNKKLSLKNTWNTGCKHQEDMRRKQDRGADKGNAEKLTKSERKTQT